MIARTPFGTMIARMLLGTMLLVFGLAACAPDALDSSNRSSQPELDPTPAPELNSGPVSTQEPEGTALSTPVPIPTPTSAPMPTVAPTVTPSSAPGTTPTPAPEARVNETLEEAGRVPEAPTLPATAEATPTPAATPTAGLEPTAAPTAYECFAIEPHELVDSFWLQVPTKTELVETWAVEDGDWTFLSAWRFYLVQPVEIVTYGVRDGLVHSNDAAGPPPLPEGHEDAIEASQECVRAAMPEAPPEPW